ncbi:reverse transcriptase [Hamiltosporidium tvaerminnensis]|uniref:Reverse transcriptase n=1 Tax=Hamiltosporidium tvaerminnensis TaxID=1176355 RepID=A0A4Q9M3C3_9MICR|nr:reverse transcriptase [Hamiltosporidium tvaerminnensis]
MNATACEPANGMTNLITAAILKESRLMALHSILDSVIVESTNGPICSIAQEENGQRRRIALFSDREEIGDVVDRTRKHLGELINFKVLNSLDRITGEYAESNVPMTITDINVERNHEGDLCVTDLSEALVKKNESLNVYEKKITMHESKKQFRKENRMFELLRVICLKGTPQADWFYCGLTYLIPKGIPRRGSDYRPITCMSKLYKLTTKCVTKVVQLEVERRGLLAENQLGAVRGVQGAKEQALLNIVLNKEYGNNLKATWIDVKKAYDSIDHAFLTQYIENLNLPDWILKFIEVIISKRKIEISVGLEKIMSKKIDRGILQGDSLSPLLFVLCMDPLSRNLNEKYTKVTVQTDAESHSTNHILIIDDLKLLAKDSSTLSAMTDEAKEFLEVIGLEINKEKSATNDKCCVSVYKYLGIIEYSRGIPTRSSFEEVQNKLISRLDGAVHAVLVKNQIHLRPGCKQCFYLPITELRKCLHSVELRSDHMLLQLLDFLKKHKDTSIRRELL